MCNGGQPEVGYWPTVGRPLVSDTKTCAPECAYVFVVLRLRILTGHRSAIGQLLVGQWLNANRDCCVGASLFVVLRLNIRRLATVEHEVTSGWPMARRKTCAPGGVHMFCGIAPKNSDRPSVGCWSAIGRPSAEREQGLLRRRIPVCGIAPKISEHLRTCCETAATNSSAPQVRTSLRYCA